MQGKKLSRVDIQVCIFTAIIVVISSICVYLLNYRITYQDMLDNLNERVESIYHAVEESFDKKTFYELNSKDDQTKKSYIEMKEFLQNIKSATGVIYLYTAKRAEDGTLIYLVDGLDSNSADFRNVGDPIEKEIISEMNRALQDEIILPDDIKNTTWGHIFVCYYPIHDQGKVVGVLGIEFSAARQYSAFRMTRVMTPIIVVITCLVAMLLAFKLFRRISNPTYMDLSNTDHLTGLKNRNAFETDMRNYIGLRIKTDLTVISADLNNLKEINDTKGHLEGDMYIKKAAQLLLISLEDGQVAYRVGGDEFVILMISRKEMDAERVIALIRRNFEGQSKEENAAVSMAIGYAVYDESLDQDLFETYHRADYNMYMDKKNQKQQNIDEDHTRVTEPYRK